MAFPVELWELRHCAGKSLGQALWPSRTERELAQVSRDALAVPGRPGLRVIAKQFGVSPMMVQNVARA
jgi:hypothetical protein